ncbi:MazG-like nucleotide pyrophosphohydrolase [Streptomyces phage Samisti12]|uniref:MazG-like nucleotide pyrophosphohydrolase n=6 Tax=Samistivirus TaxID=2560220 RepID=A0A223FZX6_9CAUD|nr:MazG-like pyrophosphatase [Streptomyces phage Samisti12]YP_010101503.1 MazG-like pyrophosphatase [Streptomyces phage EGole]ASR76513.1 MazG-like nucleotide pyrophosphohydrolase [Streptomyces phage Sushi23]QAX95818.1 MazG-like nucleotide pyrophosphohydrolase [Streptomyces phage Teutsch]QGH78272.1 MazG-like nucleotide pyrophosphohydrolase [Streptomyces phage Tribute]QRI46075.1 nucleotide pyrophosphohydrolase [Streptomyces phage Cross]WDS51878.1 MazG-like nucleotide pyrophosphohydrolase [Strep
MISGFENLGNDLSINDYQLTANETAIYPENGEASTAAINYCILGLVGEAGEIANSFKKTIRDDNGIVTGEKAKALAAELGDVLWYAANLASELGYPLELIAKQNLQKLKSRQARGVIQGSGDNR